MRKNELLEIIAGGENSGVEFKRDDLGPEQAERLARELVAFANFRGGRLLIGVEDDGTPSGINRANLEEWLMDTVFGRYIHPGILPFYEEVPVDGGKKVAVVTIETGIAKPYVLRSDGREDIYIRVGTVSRRATREQQARLFQEGQLLHLEVAAVSGATFEALHEPRLIDYLARVQREPELPATREEWTRRLARLGFMTETANSGYVCTVAGLLLFGRSPRQYLRQAGVRWMAFSGTERDYSALDDRIFDAPLTPLRIGQDTTTSASLAVKSEDHGLVDWIVDYVRPFLSVERPPGEAGIQRERFWFYHPDAIREALVNALAHRDWTRSGEVEMTAYGDRLEIVSPGALPNTLTVEKVIEGQRIPRNPIIVNILRDYGVIEARGMGVRRKIIPLTRQYAGAEPQIVATEDAIRIALPRRAAAGS
jgi:ATP-dependent DNA helicase RecG